MRIIARHTISDPARFWAAVGSGSLPEGITLLDSYRTEDGTQANCLWEAESIAAVKAYIARVGGGDSGDQYLAPGVGWDFGTAGQSSSHHRRTPLRKSR